MKALHSVLRSVSLPWCLVAGTCGFANANAKENATASTSAAANTSATVAALAKGRSLLESGKLLEAQRAYGEIPVEDPLWQEKVEDLLRYHLVKGQPQEAWRIVQLLRRTKRAPENVDDYERLALHRSGACPLAVPAHRTLHGHLIDAATYRHPQRYLRTDASDKLVPVEGASLAAGLVPHLRDIPATKLAKGQGCRVAKAMLIGDSEEKVRRAELEALNRALSLLGPVGPFTAEEHANGGSSVKERLLVGARAIELTKKIGNEAGAKALLANLPRDTEVPWLELPDPERRWIFIHYFGADTHSALKGEKKEHAKKIAISVISKANEPAAADWLAMVDLNGLALKERSSLLARVEKLGAFSGRGWVLYELARSYALENCIPESLTVLRRLLLEREEAIDEPIERASVDLAARIFGEHRFEERLVGAMQAALPSRLWSEMVEGALVRAAFAAREREFGRIVGLRKSAASRESLRGVETDLWRRLAARDAAGFKRQLKSFAKGSAADNTLIAMAGKFASELAGRGSEDRSLSSFAEALGDELRGRVRSDDGRTDRLVDFARALGSRGDWSEGARSTSRGSVNVGVARYQSADLRPSEFRLKEPGALPLRELTFVPDGTTGRGWRLSTEVR